jgi:hypothetical protein
MKAAHQQQSRAKKKFTQQNIFFLYTHDYNNTGHGVVRVLNPTASILPL